METPPVNSITTSRQSKTSPDNAQVFQNSVFRFLRSWQAVKFAAEAGFGERGLIQALVVKGPTSVEVSDTLFDTLTARLPESSGDSLRRLRH